MAHVKIKCDPSAGSVSVLVDGVEMAMSILAEGFWVEPPNSPDQPARVHMVVAADTLEADLPESVIRATREAAE